jgi:dTDP-4-dehydrorhamnose 3,5-epimerase
VIFRETALKGAYVIEPERKEDDRGFFARTWCRDEFASHGLSTALVQCNISYNHKRGTLRGMHFQKAPHAEVKLVRCTAGAIFDVIVDLRPSSPTYTRHVSVVLSSANRQMLYIPEGMAHGFQTLEDSTEVFYQMSHRYDALSAGGVRWNDPQFGIAWPPATRIIAERDQQYPDFIPEKGLS